MSRHRAAAPAAAREGTYDTPQGEVYYQDEETLRDALDLFTVLDEDHHTGSPNLENAQARGITDTLQAGQLLSGMQVATLLKLLRRHRADIEALRQSPDRQGQDFLDVPDPLTERLNPDHD